MPFGIASFRSRQQVFAFEAALSRGGVRAEVVSTPREVALGCGLSVRFDLAQFPRVVEIYHSTRPKNLIGFYRVMPENGARPRISAMPVN